MPNFFPFRQALRENRRDDNGQEDPWPFPVIRRSFELGKELIGLSRRRSLGAPHRPLFVGALVEAAERRAFQSLEHGVLKPAKTSAGFWFPCTVTEILDKKVLIKFEEPDGPQQRWISRAIVRARKSPDNIAATQLEAGTIVEVQIPGEHNSDTGEPGSRAWLPGVVQAYNGSATHPSGHVVVALDIAEECEIPRQVTVPASRVRVVLRFGWRLRVQGSGVNGVNGIYHCVGLHDGVPRFECGNMVILRWALKSGSRFWYISKKQNLEVDDGDYYRVRTSSELPPAFWSSDQSHHRMHCRPRKWHAAQDGKGTAIPSITWVPGLHGCPSPTALECEIAIARPCSSDALDASQKPEAIPEPEVSGASPSPEEPPGHACSMENETSRMQTHTQAGSCKSAEETEENETGPLCAVCLVAAADFAMIPCGHLCLCGPCSQNLRDNTPNCPVCREPSLYTQRIFL